MVCVGVSMGQWLIDDVLMLNDWLVGWLVGRSVQLLSVCVMSIMLVK